MKLPLSIVWLLVLALSISSKAADISLQLRNKQYLPPPIQDLPITEEYFNAQRPEKFQKNSNSNSKYQLFEVHTQYEVAQPEEGHKRKSLDKQITFANNNYTPSRKDSAAKTRFQTAHFSFDNHNLDVSYLGFAAGHDDNQAQIMQIVPFPSHLRHNFPEGAENDVPFSYSFMQQYHGQKYGGEIFRGPDYLPPKSQAQQYFSPSNTIEDSSKTQHHSSHQIVNNNQFTLKALDSLPPQRQSSILREQSFGYITPINLMSRQQDAKRDQQSLSANEPFKGPEYLPPNHQPQEGLERNSPFKDTNNERYYQPGVNRLQQHFISKPQFRGSDYLPPQTSFKGQDYLPPPPSQETIELQQNAQFRPSNQFKGPEYLPPGHSQERDNLLRGSNNLQSQNEAKQLNNPFKGPDYLPPPQSETKSLFKGADYLPPDGNQLESHQQQSRILPDGYDFKKPPNAKQAIEELHKLPEESPVSQIHLSESDKSPRGPATQTDSFSHNGQLPSRYDFQKPQNSAQAIKLLHGQQESSKSSTPSIQGSLPVYHFQRSSTAQLENTGFSQPPATAYDFQQLVNAGQQNSYENNQLQTFKNSQAHQTGDQQFVSNLPTDQPEPKHIVAFKGPDYLPPAEGFRNFKGTKYFPATSGVHTLSGPDYLPPASKHSTPQKSASFTPVTATFKGFESRNHKIADFSPAVGSQRESVSKAFKAPDYLPPAEKQETYQSYPPRQFQSPDYLPPTEHKIIVMYPLSSHLTNIKPNDRYGSRPFHAYGLPPAETITISNSNDIAPMYRQPTAKPQYYAPRMPYASHVPNIQTSNQYQTTPTLRQQARQALQAFMPEEIRQTPTDHFQAPVTTDKTATPLQTAEQATDKIRTVQIVKQNAIKTLKVLESLDDAGVKTIKILGTSNELPIGKHRVVKVVSDSNEQSVQTLNIFNNYQDVVNGNIASAEGKGNSYLPPITKQSATSKANA